MADDTINKVIKHTTCHAEHERWNISCQKQTCRNWFNDSTCQNCVLVSARKSKKTLQEIGDIFGVTRMRICQIEKLVLKKILIKNSTELNNLK